MSYTKLVYNYLKNITDFGFLWNENTVKVNKIYKAYTGDDVIEFGTEVVTLLLMMEQTPFAVMEISLNLGDFPFH